MRARSRHLLIAALVLSGATARGTDDPDTEIARRRFAAGAHLYEDGRYDEAIAEFMAARAVKSAPAFDYNIARSYDRLERFPAAVEWYQRFLAHAPEGPERTTAAERLVVLQERITAPVLTPHGRAGCGARATPPLPPCAAGHVRRRRHRDARHGRCAVRRERSSLRQPRQRRLRQHTALRLVGLRQHA
ncbi:MAG: tetratricopeptide repeat protein [Polyangia bacterium]